MDWRNTNHLSFFLSNGILSDYPLRIRVVIKGIVASAAFSVLNPIMIPVWRILLLFTACRPSPHVRSCLPVPTRIRLLRTGDSPPAARHGASGRLPTRHRAALCRAAAGRAPAGAATTACAATRLQDESPLRAGPHARRSAPLPAAVDPASHSRAPRMGERRAWCSPASRVQKPAAVRWAAPHSAVRRRTGRKAVPYQICTSWWVCRK